MRKKHFQLLRLLYFTHQ